MNILTADLWICDIAHAIVCDGSSPAGNTTTVQSSAPSSFQQPYLTAGFNEAQNLFNQGGPQYFPGQTYAPATGQQQAGIDLQTGRALAGSPGVQTAQQQNTATARGDYLNAGNPYMQNVFNQTAQMVTPQIAGQFEGAGRYGSGQFANALTSSLSNTAGNLAYQNYGAERSNQMQAIQNAPTLANQDYTDIAALQNAGQQQQGLNQNTINDALQRFNYAQQLPYNNLQNYMRTVSGNYGQSQTTTQPFFQNQGANIMSALTGAAGIGQAAFGAPSASGGGGFLNGIFG